MRNEESCGKAAIKQDIQRSNEEQIHPHAIQATEEQSSMHLVYTVKAMQHSESPCVMPARGCCATLCK